MKRVVGTAVCAALLALGMTFAQPVQVGILSPLTGGAAGTGQAQQAGFELALEEINAAGGVLGEPLEIIIEDTQANAEVALAAFEKLMTEDGVAFIGGGFSSGVTLALVESMKTFQPVVSLDRRRGVGGRARGLRRYRRATWRGALVFSRPPVGLPKYRSGDRLCQFDRGRERRPHP